MAFLAPVTPPVRPPAVRTCASRAESGVFAHGIPRSYRSHVIRVGPLVLIARDYAAEPRSTFRPVPGRPGRYYPQKLLLLVQASRTVTVSVPAAERHFGLVYGRSDWNIPYARGYRLRDTERRATFHGCAASTRSFVPGSPRRVGKWTDFNGSVVVAGARCVRLEVRTRSRAFKARVSFGAGRCKA